MAKCNMLQVTGYIDQKDEKKFLKKRGERGFISDSAYLRYLILKDLGLTKEG